MTIIRDHQDSKKYFLWNPAILHAKSGRRQGAPGLHSTVGLLGDQNSLTRICEQVLVAMWPFLDKAIYGIIRNTVRPIVAKCIGKYQIRAIELIQEAMRPTVWSLTTSRSTSRHLRLRVGYSA
ncbi:hypothetical protein VNO77_23371 [Canavalia gladiata]|uniref:Uncharacterized protein n=1 Tax=Canavalia gladiata TaxID=3824 RepID=A0AAN9L4B1_CANGL